MTIKEMSEKFATKGGNVSTRPLNEVTSGGSAEDFVSDGTVVKIVEASKTGYYDTRFGKNAVSVIMTRCGKDDNGNWVELDEAVQIPLSMFDRVAAPHFKEADGTVVRDKNKDLVRATGTAVNTWKRAANAAAFIEDNLGKMIKFDLIETVIVRAWDRTANALSKTETREQKVYKAEWV
jgi:hypothetical protein